MPHCPGFVLTFNKNAVGGASIPCATMPRREALLPRRGLVSSPHRRQPCTVFNRVCTSITASPLENQARASSLFPSTHMLSRDRSYGRLAHAECTIPFVEIPPPSLIRMPTRFCPRHESFKACRGQFGSASACALFVMEAEHDGSAGRHVGTHGHVMNVSGQMAIFS